MSKFKVGDKIKCVNAKGWAGFKVGDVCSITGVEGIIYGTDHPLDNLIAVYHEDDFELVTKPYTLNKMSKDIAKWNQRCGNFDVEKDTDSFEIFYAVKKQLEQVLEEVQEGIDACEEDDEQGMLDGIIDVLYTALRLKSLVEKRYDIMAGCKAVVDNNKLKITKDEEEAADWYVPEDYQRVATTIDGVQWWCIKDDNDKIRKWAGFPKVDLSFMLENEDD